MADNEAKAPEGAKKPEAKAKAPEGGEDKKADKHNALARAVMFLLHHNGDREQINNLKNAFKGEDI